MANFTVRIELHRTALHIPIQSNEYELLHAQMKAAGFGRTISLDGKTFYELPTAEYSIITDTKSIDEVLELAKATANKVGKPYSVLVTRAEHPRVFYNLKPV